MREIIARAIYEEPTLNRLPVYWSDATDETKGWYLADADRVLDAIRSARKSSDNFGADNGDKRCELCGGRPRP